MPSSSKGAAWKRFSRNCKGRDTPGKAKAKCGRYGEGKARTGPDRHSKGLEGLCLEGRGCAELLKAWELC